jgi:hypothetical protein
MVDEFWDLVALGVWRTVIVGVLDASDTGMEGGEGGGFGEDVVMLDIVREVD